MVQSPGRLQSAFNAGELDPLLRERTSLKYFGTGAARMENVISIPQGGFTLRGGLRDIGAVAADASRLFPFKASDGSVYDLVFRPGECSAWSQTSLLDTFAIAGLTGEMLPALNGAQRLDTMLLFHQDLEPLRIKHSGPADWDVDPVPLEAIPTYDYGGPVGGGSYTNGVAAVWQLEFVGLTSGTTVFTLTVSQQETTSLTYNSNMATLATSIAAAISELPNVSAGFTVTSAGSAKIDITFSGTGNEGDGWAVSGTVINKSDAAVLSVKTVVGIAPGEPVISADRGWPRCGTFYNQRLLMGGFKSLPNAWVFSRQGYYFNFDTRFGTAAGPALVPMDTDGGEAIQAIVASRNLALFTTGGEYWIAERGLSQVEPPNHVKAGERGVKSGVPVVANEGALNFASASGSVIAEFRYTDVEGNFVARDISLLAAHLVDDVKDMAIRRAETSTSGNVKSIVLASGAARLCTVLREQDIMAFTRMTSGTAQFAATSVNGRNEMMFITQRHDGRRLERLENGLLLDEAVSFSHTPASATVTGLSRFNGRVIWVVADNHVLGPFTPSGGAITLPFAVSSGYAGTWYPPVVTTLPPPRDVGPNVVLKRRARLHTAHISVQDTTSLAIAANDGTLKDVTLRRFGTQADVPELELGVTDTITVRGLNGFSMEPSLTISQLRPGKLTVRSVTLEYSF